MTGHELVDRFYSVNLSYLKWNPNRRDLKRDHDRISIVLFLLGLIETVYIMDPNNTHPDIPEFLNVN
ncbi:hypothetical protein LCGC14_1737660 [marine sediment metagenome]|uniref:Uncharacterized protein n=1 Tax=marine sediment metagenome TaxID=412755 RepID=A0A0F9HVA7_9ZZZZ